MNFKGKMREKSGITLISLVVTIIVLLILAGVTIATLTGENGILTRAQEAEVETRGAEVEERVNLWKTEREASNYINTSVKTDTELLDEMKNDGILFEEEIDRENQTITIGNRVIDYATEVTLTDIYVALYNDGTLIFNNKDEFDTDKIIENGNFGNIKGIHYDVFYGEPLPWSDYTDQITKVEITSKIVPEYTAYWFMDCYNVTSLDLSNLNTSKVTDMTNMFSGCGISSLDLSGFDTGSVTSMDSMFTGCGQLSSIDLSNFDTRNVTTMEFMFNRCTSLTSLSLSSFNTNKVTRMIGMFSDCRGLTSLDLRSFDTSNVTDMIEMFYGCSGLTSLNLSSFNTSKVTSMRTMFYGCSGLTSLDLSNFDTRNVQDYIMMFRNVTADVYIGENWNSAMTNTATGYTKDFL